MKKGIKKILIFVLAAAMILALAACSSKQEPAQTQPSGGGSQAPAGTGPAKPEGSSAAEPQGGGEPEPWVPSENDPPRYTSDEGNPFIDLEGMYQDEAGQRASMVISAYEDSAAIVSVSWADSASETNDWIMYAEMDEDGGGFSYEVCIKTHISFDEDGEATEETIYEDGTGRFVIYNNHIDWIDDKEDAGKGCRFVPVDPNATGGI